MSEKFKKALEAFDWEGMARIWHEGDIRWHAKEWKEFIMGIRNQALIEAAEVHELITQREFPRGERAWCVECAERIEASFKQAIKNISHQAR